jgi:hypothetical protein
MFSRGLQCVRSGGAFCHRSNSLLLFGAAILLLSRARYSGEFSPLLPPLRDLYFESEMVQIDRQCG